MGSEGLTARGESVSTVPSGAAGRTGCTFSSRTSTPPAPHEMGLANPKVAGAVN